MNISVSFEGPTPVLTLQGRLDGYGSSVFDKEIERCGAQVIHAVIEVSRVDFVSSIGLRSLIKTEKALRSRLGGIVLVGVNDKVADILETAGLRQQIRSASSLSAAFNLIKQSSSVGLTITQHGIEGREYSVRRNPAAASALTLLGSFSHLSATSLAADHLMPVSLANLELAFGVGGFGGSREQAAEALGEFVAIRHLAGVVPADGHCLPDFVLSDRPAQTVVYVAAALGLSGKPFGVVEVRSYRPFSVADLLKDLCRIHSELSQPPPPVLGLLILSETPQFAGACYQTKADLIASPTKVRAVPGGKGALIIGVTADEAALQSDHDPTLAKFLDQLRQYPVEPRRYFHGHAITLLSLGAKANPADPAENLRAIVDLEVVKGVAHVEPKCLLINTRVWLYLPTTFHSDETAR